MILHYCHVHRRNTANITYAGFKNWRNSNQGLVNSSLLELSAAIGITGELGDMVNMSEEEFTALEREVRNRAGV